MSVRPSRHESNVAIHVVPGWSIEPWADQTSVVWQRFGIPQSNGLLPHLGDTASERRVLFDKSVWEIGTVGYFTDVNMKYGRFRDAQTSG
jgi:hypothetical protein